jgi:hypothetical protein
VSALGPVGHRIRIHDEDLILGGRFFFQGQYVVEGEPENVRENNLGSRAVHGELGRFALGPRRHDGRRHPRLGARALERRGARLGRQRRRRRARVRGREDHGTGGRLLPLRVRAARPRTNARGVGALRIPLCSGARVRATGFHDVDGDPSSDWDVAVGANEIVFSTDHAPLRWNTLFNFWFDSDAAPAARCSRSTRSTPGRERVRSTVQLSAPVALANVYLGAGCAQDTPPTLFATGTPARAELGNASFARCRPATRRSKPTSCACRSPRVPCRSTAARRGSAERACAGRSS